MKSNRPVIVWSPMPLALLVILSGLVIQPLWRSWLNGPSVPAYVTGLALVAAGWLLLLRSIAEKLPRRRRRPETLRPLRWGLLCLALSGGYLAAELMATGYIVVAGRRMDLYEFRHKELLAGTTVFVPHPFLLFIKNPALPNVNDHGFFGDEWTLEKPAGTVRIACIGGSTTEDGYPQFMEQSLIRDGAPQQFQAMNFGTAGWTSAHSLINYNLNVRHFRPDFIILHDAANDFKTVGFAHPRTDYSHAFLNPRPLIDPWDAPLVRHTNSYALGKMIRQRARGIPPGPSLGDVVEKKPDAFNLADAQIPAAVALMRANVEAMIALAFADGSRVVLMTMPHSRVNTAWSPQFIAFMQAANDALREVAANAGVILVDLDHRMQREDYFTDPVHLTREGIELKAQIAAAAIHEALTTATLLSAR